MDKNELLDTISKYDYETFKDSSGDSTGRAWYVLTNKWDEEIVQAVLLQIATCSADSTDVEIKTRQIEILDLIDEAYKDYEEYCWHNGGDAGEWDGTELLLQVRAGKFLHPTSVALPTIENGNPNYAVIQQMVAEYATAFQQMTNTIAKVQNKAKEDTNILNILNSQDKEIARLNKELEQHKQTEQALRLENEQLKMEKKELNQMSQKLVQKTEHEDLLKTLRGYMNIAKRKNAKKRGYIKMVILEMAQSARLTLPEDMQQELDKFDDENLDRATNMTFIAPVGQVVGQAYNITSNKEEK